MKQAISLVEVLVSIMLITTVIVSVLQMKDNNLFLLDKFSSSSLVNSYFTYAVESGEKRNSTVYLSDKVDFKDDDIRRELKNIKILIKDQDLKDVSVPKNDYIKSVSVIESSYKLELKEKTMTQKFYTFKLEQN